MKRVSLFQSSPSYLTVFFFLLLFVFIAFGSALNNEFLSWDDASFVSANRMIQSFDSERLFQMATSFHTGNWYPITWFSHALDYRLFGSNPAGHHLTSILWHGVNIFLVFVLFQRLLSLAKVDFYSADLFWAGIAAALLFGLHPLRVESVVWVSQRKDLLCAFFVLAGYLAYLSYANAPDSRSSQYRYGGVLFLFFCALASKPMAVTVPFILLLLDIYPLRRFGLKAVFEKIPFFLISLGLAVVTLMAQRQAGAIVSVEQLDLADRGLNAVRSIVFYPMKVLWPVNLTALYPFPSQLTPASLWFSGSLSLIMGVSAFCVWRAKKRQWFWLVAWLYYLVSLVPVLGIVQVGGQAAADRYTYLPTISFFLLAGLGLFRLGRVLGQSAVPRFLIGACGVVLVVGLMGLTQKQVKVWKNTETLWRHTVQVFPERLPRARFFLGKDYLNRNKLADAEREFQTTLRMNSIYTEAYNGLGLVEYKRGRLQSAEKKFKKALALNSEFVEARLNLGLVLFDLGRWSQAETQYLQALEQEPDSVEVHNNLGLLYYRQGRMQEAEAQYLSGLHKDFEYFGLHFNLGNLYRAMGRLNEAVAAYRLAIRFNARWAAPHNHLGEVYLELGLKDQAEVEFTAAVAVELKNESAD